MHERRKFMSAMVAAVPVSVASSRAGYAASNDPKTVLGAWTTEHTSPVGPFREYLLFTAGGGLSETNTLLHTNSRLGLFAQFGLPLPAEVNASDGRGNWWVSTPGQVEVVFRKLLFAADGTHLGDFRVQGRVQVQGGRLMAQWESIRIDARSGDIFELGPATSEGVRIE